MLRGIYLQLGLPILFTTAHNRSEPIVRPPWNIGHSYTTEHCTCKWTNLCCNMKYLVWSRCLQSKFDLQKTLRFGATAYFLAQPKARNFGQSHVFPARRCRPKNDRGLNCSCLAALLARLSSTHAMYVRPPPHQFTMLRGCCMCFTERWK